MSAASQVIGSLVQSAIAAQHRLETELSRQALVHARAENNSIYFFRQIKFDSQFAIQKQNDGRFFFFFRLDNSSTRLVHRFGFALDAVPARPLKPDEVTKASMELAMPPFMLSSSEDQEIRAALSEAMQQDGHWQARFDVQPANVAAQAKKVARLADQGRGPVAFLIQEAPPLFLIVDLNTKDAPDGIYLYPIESQRAEIYNLPNAGQDLIFYEPLHLFALSVRNALFQPQPRKREVPSAAGVLQDLANFAADLASGYQTGRQALAAADYSPSLVPGFLEISPLVAEVRYAAEFNAPQGAASPNIIERKVADPFLSIEGAATINISSNGTMQRTQITVQMPSFVLSGENLSQFLAQARASENKITGEFSDDSFSTGVYQEAIRSRSDVVALHAFDGNKPSRDFLVVWPGSGEAAERDFVFTCHLNSDGKQLSSVKRILKLGESIGDIKLTTTNNPAGPNQYLPFHNMFHAALVWLTSVRPA
jgi:hypothetical protein